MVNNVDMPQFNPCWCGYYYECEKNMFKNYRFQSLFVWIVLLDWNKENWDDFQSLFVWIVLY